MQAGKKLNSNGTKNNKERFERKTQKMMQYIQFQYQHMLLAEEQKNSVMVIFVELANVCLHASLGAKVSGEELWHLISHMNNHFRGKKSHLELQKQQKMQLMVYSKTLKTQQIILKQPALLPTGSFLLLTRGTSKCYLDFQHCFSSKSSSRG